MHSDDMYAPESIELLTKSGIDFARHEREGIDVETFGELLISSGLVLLPEVQWVSFHRCVVSYTLLLSDRELRQLSMCRTAGTTLATCSRLSPAHLCRRPKTSSLTCCGSGSLASGTSRCASSPSLSVCSHAEEKIPELAQFLMKSCKTLKGGLQEVADDLQVRQHSLLFQLGPSR